MKNFTHIIGIICLLFTSCLGAMAQTDSLYVATSHDTLDQWRYALPVEIYNSLSKGDAVALASALNSSVELAMPQGSSNIYSRKQAEVVLSEFLSGIRNPQFSISHERSMGASTQTIGSLVGDGSKYRIFILTQQHGQSVFIHQLRFEVADR